MTFTSTIFMNSKGSVAPFNVKCERDGEEEMKKSVQWVLFTHMSVIEPVSVEMDRIKQPSFEPITCEEHLEEKSKILVQMQMLKKMNFVIILLCVWFTALCDG